MSNINPNALFFVAFCTAVGELFCSSWLGGLTTGLGLVVFVSMVAKD